MLSAHTEGRKAGVLIGLENRDGLIAVGVRSPYPLHFKTRNPLVYFFSLILHCKNSATIKLLQEYYKKIFFFYISDMGYIRKYISEPVKDVDTSNRIVKFAFAHLGSRDHDGDIIFDGAYEKTIKENGPEGKDRIFHYRNHDLNQVIGKPMEIYKEGRYMIMISKLLDTTAGRDALIEYENGVIKEHSQGFYIAKADPYDSQTKTRNIREVKLKEASSLTTWGANENTPVMELKSMKHELEKKLVIGKFSDEYIKELERELDEIQKMIHSKPGSHLEPNEEELVKALDKFNFKL